MSINATLFVQAIVFAILVWFTMKFVWPPIANALDERAEKIANGLKAAEHAHIELTNAHKHAEVELAKNRSDAAARIAEAERRAAAIIEEAKYKATEEANRIIAGTFAAAKRRKAYPLAVILLDAGGRVKAFQKQDGASLLRFEIAYGKAFAALSLNRSSRQVLQKHREKPYFMDNLVELSTGPIFLEGGGQLFRDPNGEIVGAVGATEIGRAHV